MNGIKLWVSACMLLLSVGAVVAQEQPVAPSVTSRFGIVEGFWFQDLTCDLGVGWERLIFDWSQHQPEGPDDWHTLNVDDRWLKAANGCDRQVVALLKQTPEWATEGLPGVGVPRGLYLDYDDPDNFWGQFVARAVDYYASRGVKHFVIWNEPDIDSETYGYEFSGTLDDYFQMLKVAYLAAKEANPAAVIHLAGSTYWHDVNEGRQPYMTRLVDRILADSDAADHDHYFDVLSLHIYFRTETVYSIINEMRQMLDSRGLTDKAIWVNETNAAPTDDPVWPVVRPVFQLDLVDQAAFMMQSALLALAAGADHIAAYKLYDQQLPPGGESFGLLSPPDASPRPAYHAWRAVVQHFSDVTAAQYATTERMAVVWLRHANGRQTVAAWARTDAGAHLHIEADAEKAYRMDQYGNLTVARAADGMYNSLLSSAQCEDEEGCYLGGPVTAFVFPFSGPETTLRILDMTPSGSQPARFDEE